MTELGGHSASELARRNATREVSAVEVVEAHLNRIDAVNPHVMCLVMPRRADAAEAVETRLGLKAPIDPIV